MTTRAGASAATVASDDAFVLKGRKLLPGTKLKDTSRFGDDIWQLRPAQLQKHERSHILDFRRIPARQRLVRKWR
jgi:hypothetical protein